MIVLGALLGVIASSWAYLLAGAGMGAAHGAGGGMPGMAMAPLPWSPGHAALMLLMWWIMMVAMMLPSAAPMILLFAAVQGRQRASARPYVPTTLFAAAYLLAWAGFALAAGLLHLGLDRAGLIGPHMALASRWIGVLVLLAAGLYQLTPLKHACLRHCRLPAAWLALHWRPGGRGALVMGLAHGAYCLGCCWVLMLLLFYGGVMSLHWIAGLAAYVLVEKLVPAGHWLARGTGLALIAAALLLALAPA